MTSTNAVSHVLATIDPSIWIVAIAAPAILALITAGINSRSKKAEAKQRRAEKLEDYARQDQVAESLLARQDEADRRQEAVAAEAREVARKADETAGRLAEQQRVTIAGTEEVARLTLAAREDASGQLHQIHTLVDGQASAMVADRLEGAKDYLVSLKEIIDLKRAAGSEPAPEALATLAATEAKIKNLTAELEERERQLKLAEAQAAQGAST